MISAIGFLLVPNFLSRVTSANKNLFSIICAISCFQIALIKIKNAKLI
jgi:hypothetical protein